MAFLSRGAELLVYQGRKATLLAKMLSRTNVGLGATSLAKSLGFRVLSFYLRRSGVLAGHASPWSLALRHGSGPTRRRPFQAQREA